jgi:hypothetical protein
VKQKVDEVGHLLELGGVAKLRKGYFGAVPKRR